MSAAIDALRAPSVRRFSQRTAQRIASQAQALQVAHALAQEFAQGAAGRDRERRLPFEEIERFSHSGLWAISVPRAYGGIGASWATVAEVFKIVSAADPSIGQIPQNHFGNLNVIANAGSEEQKRFFFGEALDGARFGNAGPERNSKNVLDVRTRAVPDDEAGDGSYLLTGTRFYSTGALYAHWIPSRAIDGRGDPLFVYNRADAPGLCVVDDWSSFGQRTTASGSVVFDRVRVPASQVLHVKDLLKQPNNIGPVSQLIQAAIDAGIAHAAVRDAIEFVTTRSRPYADSDFERASDDPYIIRDIGNLKLRLHASDALLERAAGVLDALPEAISFEQMAAASVAVAEAKVLSTELALLASEKLFELAGSASTLAAHNLDRHWRNARVHTLHDPVRWKYHAVGNYALNGTPPPRHSWS
ncbi:MULTISPECIES: SfnB family sulfur acquisition oxidoreductase [unclassified Herbaspirillum]|uniref:SfnB family sulfur acquisition oxidoreductase n=1 Tax=unclassified Herbaspirillum TaxID=2624150 RepID=UPI001153AF94|nr:MULTISPECIES: SfnB family sulfur acquisition oxidoreductase [unclassified Herbaspirillum]MBB5393848.1 SfnB family sulfur acquisition oxidoreductase [Herbaspirillum sp. SJZ102]TQK01297.1 SfnB family sulfur acquisition oxidoreductase [Herbaspirillum sp. SJZ130]TQK05691.1 SfnB family sulfur acquisition oxidoreductase [Herbaspirillum sp. SJZ106]